MAAAFPLPEGLTLKCCSGRYPFGLGRACSAYARTRRRSLLRFHQRIDRQHGLAAGVDKTLRGNYTLREH
jgi:hypothetical protein